MMEIKVAIGLLLPCGDFPDFSQENYTNFTTWSQYIQAFHSITILHRLPSHIDFLSNPFDSDAAAFAFFLVFVASVNVSCVP